MEVTKNFNRRVPAFPNTSSISIHMENPTFADFVLDTYYVVTIKGYYKYNSTAYINSSITVRQTVPACSTVRNQIVVWKGPIFAYCYI